MRPQRLNLSRLGTAIQNNAWFSDELGVHSEMRFEEAKRFRISSFLPLS
jgi:hypothetical protein